MLESWRRHRRRILSLAAAGAAGTAAAYAVYKCWYAEESAGDEGDQASGSGSGRRQQGASSSGGGRGGGGVLLDPRGPAGSAQLDAEAHLQHHFDSIQDIADTTTLPSLLPALSRALLQAADVETPLERLRRAKEGLAPLSPADKVAAWEELKVAAFTRAAGATWLLCLLDLFVRVQLNILGRHLYLESAVEGSGTARPAGVPKLSAPSQEQFLSYAEFLAQQGAAELLALMRQAAEAQLAAVPLQQALGAADVAQLLSSISADFAARAPAAAGARSWASFLLPDPDALRASLAPRTPDNRAVLLGADTMLVDARVVEQLSAEAATVASGQEFADTLQACTAEVLRVMSGRLSGSIGPEALPLAKAVPLVAAVGSDLLASTQRPALARLEQVRGLSARVYGCCYCADE